LDAIIKLDAYKKAAVVLSKFFQNSFKVERKLKTAISTNGIYDNEMCLESA